MRWQELLTTELDQMGIPRELLPAVLIFLPFFTVVFFVCPLLYLRCFLAALALWSVGLFLRWALHRSDTDVRNIGRNAERRTFAVLMLVFASFVLAYAFSDGGSNFLLWLGQQAHHANNVSLETNLNDSATFVRQLVPSPVPSLLTNAVCR